jgi:hypothetical protein
MSTITINGNTYVTQTMPSVPVAPAGLEFTHNAIVASSTNPFTAQQQVYNWNVNFKECSASYATMTAIQAQAWLTFLESLKGPTCVFTFPAGVCSQFPNELTTDGSAPRYWRLKSNSVKWSVKPGSVYDGITFECREVI